MGLCLVSNACGYSQLTLKSPIEQQCIDTGLKNCSHIALGATQYVDGEQAKGEANLKAGLAGNVERAEDIKRFADGLMLLSKIPGLSQYIGPMQPVIKLIQNISTEIIAERQKQQKTTQNTSVQIGSQLPQCNCECTKPKLEQNPWDRFDSKENTWIDDETSQSHSLEPGF